MAALAGFYLLAALYLRPIWRLWRTDIAPSEGDPLFVLYLLKWVGHEAGRGFAGFWDAPFFYPSRGVLAWSDHMLGPGLAAAAWNAVVPGWVGAYNALFVSSFAWTAAAMAWVLRRSGRSVWAALLGGALYAFCPFRWDQLPHLQVLLMAAVPLTLWSFDRLLAHPTARRSAAFLACYAVHLSGGCYLAVMIHIPLLVLALNRLALPRLVKEQAIGRARHRAGRWAWGWLPPAEWTSRVGRHGAVLAVTFGAAATLLGATFWEYRRASARAGLSWTADAQRHWGASLLSYLQPSDSNLYAALWPHALFRSENCLFPGWLAAALCLLGLVLWRRRLPPGRGAAGALLPTGQAMPPNAGSRLWRCAPLALVAAGWSDAELWTWSEAPRFAGLGRWVWWPGYTLPLFLVVAGTAGWAFASRHLTGRWPWARLAALAPWPRGILFAGAATALLTTPLFYLPLARVVPGFAAMRVPPRFQAFTMVSVVFFAAAAFDALAARLRAPGRTALFYATMAAAAAVELAPRPLPWGPVPEEGIFPPVYAWLAERADVGALLELPLGDNGEEDSGAALQAMYFGTRHWRPLVNGYSAHFAPLYERLEAECCFPMPEGALLADLRNAGVTHILVHRSDLSGWQLGALDGWAAANHAALIHSTTDGDRVYRLRPAGP